MSKIADGKYEISKDGEVRNVNTLKSTKAFPDKDGYLKVVLSVGKKSINLRVHRLIAIHYIPNPNNYEIVNHKNGIKTDNRIDNLEWCTVQQNSTHASVNKLLRGRPGVEHHNVKLSEKDILEIKELVKNNTPRKQIAKKFNIHKNHIYRLIKGTRWKHLTK